MKKLIALLLALVLLSNMAIVYLLAENNRLLKDSLEGSAMSVPERESEQDEDKEEEDMEQNRRENSRPEASGDTQELAHVAEDKYLEADGAWHFNFAIRNTTDTDLFIHSLTFIDNGGDEDLRTVDSDPQLFEMMMGPEFATKPLAPGEVMIWNDGHPGEYLTDRTYLFAFIGADGKTYTATYAYNLLMEEAEGPVAAAVDYASDKGQDLLTLRHGADFEVPVAEDVFWVPASHLGHSAYTNEEIFAMLGETPEVKQQALHTLYEALQLYQVGGFAASDDNIRMTENGINWEHHKPGYYAVTTNNGCCATSANWLNYILREDYEQVGFIATSQRDGSGHIYNYLFHDGWYYFIDLTHYRTDWVATAVETGDPDDYYRTDFILGNIHKAKSVEAYVNYVQSTFSDPPGLMFQYTAQDCLAIDGARDGNTVTIVYEDSPEVSLAVIFDDPSDQLEHTLVTPPEKRPDWE